MYLVPSLRGGSYFLGDLLEKLCPIHPGEVLLRYRWSLEVDLLSIRFSLLGTLESLNGFAKFMLPTSESLSQTVHLSTWMIKPKVQRILDVSWLISRTKGGWEHKPKCLITPCKSSTFINFTWHQFSWLWQGQSCTFIRLHRGFGSLRSVGAPRPWGVREHQYSCRVDVCVCPRNHSGDTLPYLCENKTFRERQTAAECLWFLSCAPELPKWIQPNRKNV